MIETERLFFAIWPDESVVQHLKQLAEPVMQTTSGKITPPENWHLTLAFLGNIDQSHKQCMEKAATQIQSTHFTLTFEQFGYWSKNRILWLGVDKTPDTLTDLVKQLNQQLYPCGYSPEIRPFKAHLTLMRKAFLTKALPPIFQPVVWMVDHFCLVRSTIDAKGASYEIIRRWFFN
jgi:2'-5' RNA ligase